MGQVWVGTTPVTHNVQTNQKPTWSGPLTPRVKIEPKKPHASKMIAWLMLRDMGLEIGPKSALSKCGFHKHIINFPAKTTGQWA